MFGTRDNYARADSALVALNAFTEADLPGYADESLETRVADLICNLLHLVRRDGTEGEYIEGKPELDPDPTDLLDRARHNFEAEEEEENEDEEDTLCECGRPENECAVSIDSEEHMDIDDYQEKENGF